MRRAQQPIVTSTPKFDAKNYTAGGMPESQVRSIKQYFDLFDTEGTGSINPKKLKAALKQLGGEATNHTVYQLICDYDADGKGSIGFQDFLHLMTRTVSSSDSRETMRKVFSLYDDDKTGYISVASLRRLAHDIGQDISEKELQLMVDRADTDRDGYVSFAEFYGIISRRGTFS